MSTRERQGRQAVALDRREFLGVAGAAGLSVLLPWPAAAGAASPGLAPHVPAARFADWRADDVWGTYPRYAEPIPFAKPHTSCPLVDPLDAF